MYTLEDLEHLLEHKDGFMIVVVIFGEIHEQVNISCKQHFKKSLSVRIKGRLCEKKLPTARFTSFFVANFEV